MVVVQFSPAIPCNQQSVPLARFTILVLGLDLYFLKYEYRPVVASGFGRGALLLGPGRNHAVTARVRDRLPQMLVLIFENQHQRALLRHVSSEQFHRRLQVVVGICTKSDL